jgi:DNA (cytosine-5)-methyltransferase 1
MQNGALYQLPILVQIISVKEFGSEPNNETFFHTPTTTGLDGGSNGRKALKKRLDWPTPTASRGGSWRSDGQISMIAKNVETYEEYLMLTKGSCKSKLNKYWPTPMSTEHKANRQTRENHQNGLTQAVLQAETKMLPTPCNRDYKGAVKSGKRITKSGKTQNYGEQLPNVVGGQLNPTWVEWLMGWPVGWTDLKPLEMDKSLYVQQLHGSYLNE